MFALSFRRLTFLFFFLSASALFAEDNVVIQTPILESHFFREVKQPLFVKYELFKGGGDCDRAGMSFKNDRPDIETATSADYSHSGFDIGHLANAEDFAGNCDRERMTFVFYNAVPQTPNLNRGVWKRVETTVRNWSQSDHLLVICGGTKFVKRERLYVPKFCYKVVQSETSNRILFCGIFTNTGAAKESDLTEAALEKRLGYSLPIIRVHAQAWMRNIFVSFFWRAPQ
jgi:endonuclease G, mitochondrial